MALVVHALALEVIVRIRPLVARIARHDRSLADQLRRALSSVALNVAEAEYSDPGTQRARFPTATGSASEARSAVAVAVAWGYVAEVEVADALALLDRAVAMLWRLVHPKR